MDVFIVEDSAVLRDRLSQILTSIEGVHVVGYATNAGDAITRIQEQKPDIVVLDIRLSASTGFDVLRAVRAGSALPRIIVLTNYPYPQYRKKYVQAGADYFFDKSTEFEQVVQVLRNLATEAPGSESGHAAHRSEPFRDSEGMPG